MGMRIAVFGGSFDPVHTEHVAFVRHAIGALRLDKVLVMPSYRAPHKISGASAEGKDRLEMCKIAFSAVEGATVCDWEIAAGGTSYTYLTCRRLREEYPDAERYLLVGADMLSDFYTWREPDDILQNVRLAACGRGEELPRGAHDRFCARFQKDFIEVPFTGKQVSSTQVRVKLAFGKRAEELPDGIEAYCRRNGLYSHPAILPALALEKEERREHSFRAALLACKRARTFKISESAALLALALHDCAKYVPLTDPLLCGFSLPDQVPAEVPPPVLHQFTGAYLAEHRFGVADEEILDAIRYHASGRPGMTSLGKLVYLADLLEEGRTFRGVEELRTVFAQDLDRCLKEALSLQLSYLKGEGREVYPLTQQTFEWICEALKNKK